MKQRLEAVQGDTAAASAARAGSHQANPVIPGICAYSWSTGHAETPMHPVFADTTKLRLVRLTEASP